MDRVRETTHTHTLKDYGQFGKDRTGYLPHKNLEYQIYTKRTEHLEDLRKVGNNIKIRPRERGCNKFDWFAVTIPRVPPKQRTSPPPKKKNAPETALRNAKSYCDPPLRRAC